jgi:hypothetical protein
LRFDSLKSQAKVFAANDGLSLVSDQVALRNALQAETGLQYRSPETHPVWRQYQRAFRLGLLVDVDPQRQIRPTDVCRLLAADSDPGLVADDFFLLFANRFCLPFPGFEGFTSTGRILYPACAILKLLLAKGSETHNFSLSAQEAIDYIEGNALTGTESIDLYRTLQPVPTPFESKDEPRQVREFLGFLTQISWLYWEDQTIKLSTTITESFLRQFSAGLQPDVNVNGMTKGDAYVALSSITEAVPIAASQEEDSDHIMFFEGNRRAVTHLRVERNSRLRKALFASLNSPALCDVCKMIPREIYPWVGDFFDIHHLLPLSSPIARNEGGTALSDVRPICPNCHRAVHAYYGNYLRVKRRSDFVDRNDAMTAYHEAKQRILK